MLVCLLVTAESIGPKLCVGPHVTPGEVYEWLKLKKKLTLKIFDFLQFFYFIRFATLTYLQYFKTLQ